MIRSSQPRTLLIILWAATVLSSIAAELGSQSSISNIWQSGVGEGFQPTVQSIHLGAGAGPGLRAFGSREAHDLALVSVSYAHMLGRVRGVDHWYRGNWEFRGELFGGSQFAPSSDWLVGLTPHLRYSFGTGTRWIPFLDGGAGVTTTGIGRPDLGNTFEFNLQASAGVHWLIRDSLALTVEARYIHLSCAGISDPNRGLNSVLGMLGVTWFF